MQIVEISEPGASEQSEAGNEIVVGIDFGTTNSLIAVSNNHKAEIIKMSGGLELLPSIINIIDGKVTVGRTDVPKNIIRSIKRLLAKSSEEITNNITLASLSDMLVLNAGMPKIALRGIEISLAEMASELFKVLKSNAELVLGHPVQKAVVSVPAYFDDSARGQVLFAAQLAGFEVMRLIAEPTAAAYAYGLQNNTEGAYLVYDLGGGTFDVSILNMQSGVLQVVATGGDNMLGGDDIDMLLAEYLSTISDFEVNTDLIARAKEIKEELSFKSEVIFNGNIISRNKYETIISTIIERTIKIAKETLYDTQSIKLDGIILVGGSTRVPLIASRLKETFSVPIYTDLDPDKIVALGAALQAENLSSKSNALLIDVMPLSVGLGLYGGIVEKLIMRNTPIPFSITKEFTTHADNQTGMQFHVVQGEREMVKDCRSLADFELTGIPYMKAGQAKVQITFTIDANGILSVTARQVETGRAHNIEIKPSFGLNEKEINAALSVAFANAEQDHIARLLAETREDADSVIAGLQKAVNETPDVLSKKERDELDNAINSLQEVINLDNRDIILLKMTALNKLAEAFIQKHLDKGAHLHLKGRHIDEINNN
ncbi:MAG: Hsp70 family protein [Rickettsiaceae bacterium]|nr:Hsp70 family protein [Rickettsiaceae bacterium]MDP4832549.1 Hsp70 family protein [Rickettsiaceae bacterium]MDP5020209.1 Hsp70 family protein [Rickettsiaceae bacterium]MDP5082895.1 Hsp70 family protein [Rickettsiaceae bacterium]